MEQKPQATFTGSNIEKAEAVKSIDAIVSELMGLDEVKPFSSDRNLVNDMVALSNEKNIKLPKFTADPFKIANAIAESVKSKEN